MTTVPSLITASPDADGDHGLDRARAASDTAEAGADGGAAEAPGRFADYGELTKARLSTMVVMTAGVGFVMAAPTPMPWMALGAAVAGTALAAASASVLNQLAETRRDGLMERTRDRPMPTGRIGPRHALVLGVLLAYLGVTVLAVGANWLAAGLALGNILLYVLVYTPMKPRTTLNTLVGAVCGAVPPMIGWAAATGALQRGAWILAAILFVWQLPHFMALAWLYRDDYRRGGYAMLPVVDHRGRVTGQVVLLTSAMLVPLGLMMTLAGYAGFVYALAALVLGLGMTALAARMAIRPDARRARAVFLASIAYLPLLMVAMVLDRGPVAAAAPAVAPEPAAMPTVVPGSDVVVVDVER